MAAQLLSRALVISLFFLLRPVLLLWCEMLRRVIWQCGVEVLTICRRHAIRSGHCQDPGLLPPPSLYFCGSSQPDFRQENYSKYQGATEQNVRSKAKE